MRLDRAEVACGTDQNATVPLHTWPLRVARKTTSSVPALSEILRSTLKEPLRPAVVDLPLAATEPLSAEEARRAVVDLIRRRPGLFIGNPDPDRLAKLPLIDAGEGKYQFGVITVHPREGRYNARVGEVGRGLPEVYEYTGTITRAGDGWLASEPTVNRFHQLP